MGVPRLLGITLQKVISVPAGLSLLHLAGDPVSRSLVFSTNAGGSKVAQIQVCLDWENPVWKTYSYENHILEIPGYTPSSFDIKGIDLKYPWLYFSALDGTTGLVKRIDITKDSGVAGPIAPSKPFGTIGISYFDPIQAYIAMSFQVGYYGPRYVPFDTLTTVPLGIGPSSYWYECHYSKLCNVISFIYSYGSGSADSTRTYFLKNPFGISWEKLRRVRSILVDPVGYPLYDGRESVNNTAYDDLTDSCIISYGGLYYTHFAITKGFTAEGLDANGYAPAPVKLIDIPDSDTPYRNTLYYDAIPIECYNGWLFVLGKTGIITAINLETYEQVRINVLPTLTTWKILRIYPGGILIAGSETATAQIAIAKIEMISIPKGNYYLNLSKPSIFIASGEADKPGLDLHFPRWTRSRR